MRAREFFERGEFVPEDRGARANAHARRASSAAADAGRRTAFDRFLATMPDRYFLSTPEEVLADHAALRASA